MIARVARVGVASAALCAAVAANAQSIEPAHFVAPSSVVSVAAPAGMPAVTAAVIAPQTRPVLTLGASAPNAAQPVSCSAPAEMAHLDRPLLRTARRLASGEPVTIVALGSSSFAAVEGSSDGVAWTPLAAPISSQQYQLVTLSGTARYVRLRLMDATAQLPAYGNSEIAIF